MKFSQLPTHASAALRSWAIYLNKSRYQGAPNPNCYSEQPMCRLTPKGIIHDSLGDGEAIDQILTPLRKKAPLAWKALYARCMGRQDMWKRDTGKSRRTYMRHLQVGYAFAAKNLPAL